MCKNNEQMRLFEILDSTRNKYLLSQEEEKVIYRKMNEELEQATQRIRLSYQEKINTSKNNCQSLKKELANYKKLLEKYSTFDSKMIGNIIAQLVSIIEGEEYSYQEATHKTYKYESTVFGSESFRTNKKLLMIVKGNEKYASYYDYNEQNNVVYKLVKSGQAIVLSESEFDYDKKIVLYTCNEGSVESLIDFNKLSYVKEFVNLVIQYRYEKHLENISEKELLNIVSQFILSKKELIEENYKKRAIEKQEQLIQKFIKVQENMSEEKELQEFEALLKNGVPTRYANNLIDRLQKLANYSADFNTTMIQIEIFYEGEKNTATITCNEPLTSSENIFVSKINIESSINYFDDSDPDPHFHGDCNINLVDDGLIGIVDISNINKDLIDSINAFLPYGLYKVDIMDKYLRILYLPNKGEYRHKPINIYSWIMEELLDTNKKEVGPSEKNTSYKTEWNIIEESDRMLSHLKEIELVSNFNQKQLKLYKQRKNNN